jgi:hypothetical protein
VKSKFRKRVKEEEELFEFWSKKVKIQGVDSRTSSYGNTKGEEGIVNNPDK